MHANHSYLPPHLLLLGGSSAPIERTGNATNALLNALPVSPGEALLTQATSSHWGMGVWGGERHKIPHEAKAPHNSWGRRTRHTIAFACNKYLPTGRAALSESFSTLRERVATSLGLSGRGGAATHTSRAQPQEVPGESCPYPRFSDSPVRAS